MIVLLFIVGDGNGGEGADGGGELGVLSFAFGGFAFRIETGGGDGLRRGEYMPFRLAWLLWEEVKGKGLLVYGHKYEGIFRALCSQHEPEALTRLTPVT